MNSYIQIIQNILKKQNRYDLVLKIENCYFKEHQSDASSGEINLFVHPNYYLDFVQLNKDDLSLLIQLFNGLTDYDYEISSIVFTIDTNRAVEKVNDTVYIFVDEAGDMDFSVNGSKHYMFNFLVKKRPFNLHEYISSYRYSLLERNLDPLNGKRLNIESFHAHNDNKFIKHELFNIISTFNENDVKLYSYILEKPKVTPDKRKENDKFYINNLNHSIQRLLDKIGITSNIIIITDNLPVHKNKAKQIGALKKGLKEYIKHNNLNIRYDIFHHCSASSANLQIVDYMGWAIYRKYEHLQDNYYNKISKYIIDEDVMTKDRTDSYYER
ncbi:hypothetical protein M947_01065 [Sulfurimonas hongkongensis]|uniref:DUF3800 domain-containing protein n=1 Tax=Sulfurimonas hongkongensis TaxID=1172190 RepID=T0JQH9_9BACT|nr:DUF3800 domain-containing protein [Sulfurimonas hongkongensis]EQB40416.1 hypothetical protein M947_01065 [Sulfurimonas hongkongensis]